MRLCSFLSFGAACGAVMAVLLPENSLPLNLADESNDAIFSGTDVLWPDDFTSETQELPLSLEELNYDSETSSEDIGFLFTPDPNLIAAEGECLPENSQTLNKVRRGDGTSCPAESQPNLYTGGLREIAEGLWREIFPVPGEDPTVLGDDPDQVFPPTESSVCLPTFPKHLCCNGLPGPEIVGPPGIQLYQHMQDCVEIGDHLPCWGAYDVCCRVIQGARVNSLVGTFCYIRSQKLQKGKKKGLFTFP